MKTFNLIMLVICSMSCGMKLMSGSWILSGVMALCTIYWFVTLVRSEKKEVEKEFEVHMSDETKETLNKLGVKINVNGEEII